ncbi:ABC transporter substrate-binding protein [Deinococcus peraridilitoris]|uniref:ABC-type dipeptide transport system, periplasmic component n=1 Tax=Deinococcus peraridilitoris (strain DSM 19664 / LMG 22246 / CIP 109416 / KR-200) TaxID=937777 RepID=L0A8D5_DEIPD|nr:ABC transporter substrate-binding protein [Deinococcus peraridilitoris]AFZ69442.1 ABC-type dipeptide transport system, periplasmic component [Deinococcus peraridilitoris DSM 19664]
MRKGLFVLGAALALSSASAQGDILKLPLINDPIMNPLIAPDLGSILINKVIFPGLVRQGEDLLPRPDLAKSWKVSNAGLVYTFNLRDDVKWHDGKPFSADDVVFTFKTATDPKSGSRLVSDFSSIKNVEAVNKNTVKFTLSRPFAPFLTLLGHNAGIVPKHLLEGKDLNNLASFNRQNPIGTGPFKVVRSVPGSSITLEVNKDYYGAKPKLSGVTFKVVPDINAQVAQLKAGELNWVTIEPNNLPSVQNDPNIAVKQASAIQHFLVFFNMKNPLFAEAKVREAMQYAVNRKAIIDGVLKGYADYPTGTIPTALSAYYDKNIKPIQYDPERAKTILAQAGWKPNANGQLVNAKGEPFKFTLLVDKGNPSREQAALAVQQDLKRIGMDVTLDTKEFGAVVRDYLLPGKYDANLIWWNTAPDPDQYSYYGIGQSNNQAFYANPKADSLLKRGRETTDLKARQQIYSNYQRLTMTDPPVLVLYYPKEIQAVSKSLTGVPNLGIRDALRYTEVFDLK